MIVMVTATGEEHGLISQLPNSVPFDDFKNMDPKYAEEMRKKKKEDSKIVEAQYLNHDGVNERLPKPYCKYAGDPIQNWRFIPGYTYRVPKGLVDEVNESVMPQRAGLQSVDGRDVTNNGAPQEKDSFRRIHQFIPTKF